MSEEISGYFVRGGLCITEKGEPDFWVRCWVRIDCIKIIHQNMAHENCCHFYTYKDERYTCSMSSEALRDEINKTLFSTPALSLVRKGNLQ